MAIVLAFIRQLSSTTVPWALGMVSRYVARARGVAHWGRRG
jgi:hypothetical protein